MLSERLDPRTLVFQGTASQRGRSVAVCPQNSVLKHLCYGRIRLDATLPAVSFETGGRETALLSMRGSCRITVGGTGHDIGLHDAIYIPRGSLVEVTTSGEVDLVEVASEVSGDYPL